MPVHAHAAKTTSKSNASRVRILICVTAKWIAHARITSQTMTQRCEARVKTLLYILRPNNYGNIFDGLGTQVHAGVDALTD